MIRLNFEDESFDVVVAIGRGSRQIPSDEAVLKEMLVGLEVEKMCDEFKEEISALEAEHIDILYKCSEASVLVFITVDCEAFLLGSLKNRHTFSFYTEQSEEARFLARTASYVWNGVQHSLTGDVDVEFSVKELNVNA